MPCGPGLDEVEWPVSEVEFLAGEVTPYPTVVVVTPRLPEHDGAKGDPEENQGGDINRFEEPLGQRSSGCRQRIPGGVCYRIDRARLQNIAHKAKLVWIPWLCRSPIVPPRGEQDSELLSASKTLRVLRMDDPLTAVHLGPDPCGAGRVWVVVSGSVRCGNGFWLSSGTLPAPAGSSQGTRRPAPGERAATVSGSTS